MRPKRSRISARRRGRAHKLELELKKLQMEFAEPKLFEILQDAITRAHRIAESSREGDRDLVFLAITEQGCNVMDDICDQTGLSRWEVQPILEELLLLTLIEKRRQHRLHNRDGQPEILYVARHTPAGSNFFLNNLGRPASPETED